jgi:hypothetical protein
MDSGGDTAEQSHAGPDSDPPNGFREPGDFYDRLDPDEPCQKRNNRCTYHPESKKRKGYLCPILI